MTVPVRPRLIYIYLFLSPSLFSLAGPENGVSSPPTPAVNGRNGGGGSSDNGGGSTASSTPSPSNNSSNNSGAELAAAPPTQRTMVVPEQPDQEPYFSQDAVQLFAPLN